MKILIFILSLCLCFSLHAETKKPAQKIVVHLTKGTSDLRASVMAFRLAKLFQEKGAQTTVFLDQEGGRWADPKQTKNLFAKVLSVAQPIQLQIYS
jgi:hypothetical protein